MKKILKTINGQLKNGKSVVVASILAESGSTPRGAGAKMVVKEDLSIVGTIGGGAVEFKSINIASEIFNTKQSFEKEFILTKNQIEDLGMICGGNVTVYFQYIDCNNSEDVDSFNCIWDIYSKDKTCWLITEIDENQCAKINIAYLVNDRVVCNIKIDEEYFSDKPHFIINATNKIYIEPITPKGMVYIFGGGHISQALSPLVNQLDFPHIIYDNIEAFSNDNLFPTAKKCIVAPFEQINSQINISKDDYCIIMTRGHENDFQCLTQCLETDAYYVGVIGSRKKIAITKQRLVDRGFSDQDISRMVAPIGLDIKGETPIEIAVSIAAQLIEMRSYKK